MHDDWEKIIEKLKGQTKTHLTFQPFHVEKTLIFLKDKEQARLLCSSNKDWNSRQVLCKV